MVFIAAQPRYVFNFSPCTSVQSLDMAVTQMAGNLGMARYVRIWKDTASTLNINEVAIYDCNSVRITPAFATLSTAHGAGPAYNCINNDSITANDFCHTNAPTNNWLEVSRLCAPSASTCIRSVCSHARTSHPLQVDLGSAMAIGNVIITNRRDCCQDRIRELPAHIHACPVLRCVCPL